MSQPTLNGSLSVAVTATDLTRSLDFYSKGLGFTEAERWEEAGKLSGVMLSAGEAHIGLSQDDFSKGRDRTKGVGLSIHVETNGDIAALADRAKQAGVKLDREAGPLPWGPMGFSAKDPDGIAVFISNPAKK